MAIGLLVLAVCIGGYQWIRSIGSDPDILPGDSTGMIAAVELGSDGSKVVVFNKEGEQIHDLGEGEKSRDESPSWRNDGQRLFFHSDREERTFHIYRWRPGSGAAERRTIGRRSRTNPDWGFINDTDANKTALILGGGMVMEFDPSKATTAQLLPPPSGTPTLGEEGNQGGSVDQFSGVYGRLGTSFTKAKWTLDRRFIVATMQRDNGQVLVVQDMQPVQRSGQTVLLEPVPVMVGETIDFDVTATGQIAVSLFNFRWLDADSVPEQFIMNGVATRPFTNALFLVNAEKPLDAPQFLAIFPIPGTDMPADAPISGFGLPRFSPSGDQLFFTIGEIKKGTLNYDPKELRSVAIPLPSEPSFTAIAQGAIRDLSISANGEQIAFIRSEDGFRSLFIANSDGSNAVQLGKKDTNYASPAISPMY